MTLKDLEKQDKCKHLLEAPAPDVVGKLIAELRRYIEHYGELPLNDIRPEFPSNTLNEEGIV
jgi:hypothetical protein